MVVFVCYFRFFFRFDRIWVIVFSSFISFIFFAIWSRAGRGFGGSVRNFLFLKEVLGGKDVIFC